MWPRGKAKHSIGAAAGSPRWRQCEQEAKGQRVKPAVGRHWVRQVEVVQKGGPAGLELIFGRSKLVWTRVGAGWDEGEGGGEGEGDEDGEDEANLMARLPQSYFIRFEQLSASTCVQLVARRAT